MKIALTTIVVGKNYESFFNQFCLNSWEAYCEKQGYDLIIIDEVLDKSDRAAKRSIAWQKLLILSQPWSTNYDRIIWVDSDIIINTEAAGNIIEGVPIDKIGAVDGQAIPSAELHLFAMDRLYSIWEKHGVPFMNNRTADLYYTNRGIETDGTITQTVQTGVMVFSPKYHREFLEQVYINYEDRFGGEGNYEMPALSYEVLKNDLICWISPRYNFVVSMAYEAFYYDLVPQKRRPLINFISRVTNKLFKRPLKRKVNPVEIRIFENIYNMAMFMHFAGWSGEMYKMEKTLKNKNQYGLPGNNSVRRHSDLVKQDNK